MTLHETEIVTYCYLISRRLARGEMTAAAGYVAAAAGLARTGEQRAAVVAAALLGPLLGAAQAPFPV